MGNENLLVIANLLVCSIGGWVCICRMAKMSQKHTKLVIRSQYTMLFTFFGASGWSFFFGDPASPIQLFMSVMVACHVLMGIPVWKHGTPDYARREAIDSW